MNTPDSPNRQFVENALSADVNVLYAAIGQAERANRFGIALPDRAELAAAGRAWLAAKRDELAAIICHDETLQKLLLAPNAPTADKVTAVLLVADLIVTICHGVPAVLVSSLLLKVGLREWCAGDGDDLRA